mgnify:CR=1 FL=1
MMSNDLFKNKFNIVQILKDLGYFAKIKTINFQSEEDTKLEMHIFNNKVIFKLNNLINYKKPRYAVFFIKYLTFRLRQGLYCIY